MSTRTEGNELIGLYLSQFPMKDTSGTRALHYIDSDGREFVKCNDGYYRSVNEMDGNPSSETKYVLSNYTGYMVSEEKEKEMEEERLEYSLHDDGYFRRIDWTTGTIVMGQKYKVNDFGNIVRTGPEVEADPPTRPVPVRYPDHKAIHGIGNSTAMEFASMVTLVGVIAGFILAAGKILSLF